MQRNTVIAAMEPSAEDSFDILAFYDSKDPTFPDRLALSEATEYVVLSGDYTAEMEQQIDARIAEMKGPMRQEFRKGVGYGALFGLLAGPLSTTLAGAFTQDPETYAAVVRLLFYSAPAGAVVGAVGGALFAREPKTSENNQMINQLTKTKEQLHASSPEALYAQSMHGILSISSS